MNSNFPALLLRFFFAVCLISTAGCAAVYDRSEAFVADHTAKLGEATVGVEFVPTDSGAGVAITAMVIAAVGTDSRGPYRVAVYAAGPKGSYESLTVTRLRFDTPDGRKWEIPERFLGSTKVFFPTRVREIRQGAFIVPTLLNLDFATFPEITVTADVRLKTIAGKELSTTTVFHCNRQKKRDFQSYFLPTEIVESLRMNDVPLEHMEIGVNRHDWQP